MDEKKFEALLDQKFTSQAEMINAGFESQRQYTDERIGEVKNELSDVKKDMEAGFYRLGAKIDNNVDSLALRVQRIEKHIGLRSEVIEIK